MTTADRIAVSNDVDEKIIVRIQKLLALAEHETSNVGEAGNAAAKVQELLDAYNLEMTQILAYNTDGSVSTGAIDVAAIRHVYGPYTSALNKGWQQLMAVVAQQHNCSVILNSGYVKATESEMKKSKQVRQSGHKRVARFVIIGERINAETTITVFDWLRKQLENEATKEWPSYRDEMISKRRDPGDPIPFRVNFLFGASGEINRIMTEHREKQENYEAVTALAVNYDQANQDYITENFNVTNDVSGSQAQANGYAYWRGVEAGGRIERSRDSSLTAGE